MKKLLTLFLVVIMALSLVACGGSEDKITGTYKADSVEVEGVKYTISELEAMGNDSLSTAQIVIKDGGKAYISDDTSGDIVDWEKTENGIKIGGQECTSVDDFLCIEHGEGTVYFKKISDSQEITQMSNNEDGDTDADENTDSGEPKADETPTPNGSNNKAENNSADVIRPEFKEAMDSYEAFYDEYCDFIKKYKANPSDLKLLTKYADMVEQLEDMNEKFEDWEDNDLSDTELKYYLEVNNRISQKMIDAT